MAASRFSIVGGSPHASQAIEHFREDESWTSRTFGLPSRMRT